MFSSKWLIDDMGLQGKLVVTGGNAGLYSSNNYQTQVEIVRDIVQQAP